MGALYWNFFLEPEPPGSAQCPVRAAKLLWGAILQEVFLQFCVVSFYCHGHPKAEEAILKLRKAVMS